MGSYSALAMAKENQQRPKALGPPSTERKAKKMSWQFTVGLRVQGKADRIVVDAEDALVAALKVKAERPEVAIMYIRRLNRRGDTRHPPHTLTGGR